MYVCVRPTKADGNGGNYENEELIVLNNFYAEETTVSIDNIEEYEVMISNYQDHDLKKELHIRPYETVALYKKK